MFRPDFLDHSSRGHGATLRPLLQVLSAVLCLSAAAACGGDDSDDNTGASAGASGSAAGTGGGGAGGAVAPPMPVACGATMCYPPSNPLSGILSMFGGALGGALPMATACCLDESAGTCGVSAGGGSATCEALATTDTRCPKANLGMLGALVNITPCCLDNKCGQDGKLFGRGCVENSEVKSMLGPLAAGGMFELPASSACDAPMMPTTPTTDPDDAGVPNDTDAGK